VNQQGKTDRVLQADKAQTPLTHLLLHLLREKQYTASYFYSDVLYILSVHEVTGGG